MKVLGLLGLARPNEFHSRAWVWEGTSGAGLRSIQTYPVAIPMLKLLPESRLKARLPSFFSPHLHAVKDSKLSIAHCESPPQLSSKLSVALLKPESLIVALLCSSSIAQVLTVISQKQIS
ncbi:UNVERIFIED_CONTAM: hypothetical protein Sangu_3158900 [Sesamum angustifolium]|uniref:Uncharacterized protein n=1 Tax=Sesamum angustifolium TaxID=2727405 RepID=A0AAW2JWT7_9LAMI